MLLMNQPEKHKIQKMNDEFKSLNLGKVRTSS